MQQKLTREARTAYHEAGHAVAAYRLAQDAVYCGARIGKLQSVTILPNPEKDTLGHARQWLTPTFRPDISVDARTRLRVEAHAIVLLAGSKAERRAAGRYDHRGARNDYRHAADLAMRACANEREANAFLRWLAVHAETLIDFHWPEVEALAAALLQRKTLTKKQVEKIMESPWRPPDLRRNQTP